VLDRARAGVAHREWNASAAELRPLVRGGILTERELDALVVARYRTGLCRFAGGASHEVQGVLDHAVDAGGLLSHVRSLAESRGVTFLDGHSVVSHASGPRAVTVRARRDGATVDLVARVLVDARGASSPFASGDLVCPTVGGVMAGLEMDPSVGEILVTVDSIEAGRQHVWEGFPGRPGETAVYLFYYARAVEPVSLVELYSRFWDTLPTYKRGDARLLRPTFGFIPGWSRLGRAPTSPDPRLVLVGDAAARHSPLTYCGFGYTLRSFLPMAEAVVRAAEGDSNGPPADEPIHALTGALARMMSSRELGGNELNELLDAAFSTLAGMGQDHYASLLRDEMAPRDFVRFLRRTAARHPSVWGKVARGLGIALAGRWGWGVARSVLSSSRPPSVRSAV
jgi:lycopene cyclase CruA